MAPARRPTPDHPSSAMRFGPQLSSPGFDGVLHQSRGQLTGITPTDHLIPPWFDETDPTHDLAARATNEPAKGVISQ